jgi:hypothetical protein
MIVVGCLPISKPEPTQKEELTILIVKLFDSDFDSIDILQTQPNTI